MEKGGSGVGSKLTELRYERIKVWAQTSVEQPALVPEGKKSEGEKSSCISIID